MKINLIKTAIMATLLYVIAGCDGINFSNFKIEYPINGEEYIGLEERLPSSNAQGTTPLGEFKITYTETLSDLPEISLNGQGVSEFFTFSGPTEATASSLDLAPFLRQGSNTLTVAPASFGPSITFNLDAQGPSIIITKGEVSADKTNTLVEGFLRDYSDLNDSLEVSIYNVLGYENTGALKKTAATSSTINVDPATGEFSGNINIDGKLANPLVYELKAKDKYGFNTTKSYQADDANIATLPLQNALQASVGSTLVQALRPIIANSIYETVKVAPLDVRADPWNDSRVCTINGQDVRGTVANKAYTQSAYDRQKQALEAGGNANPTDAEVFAGIQSCQDIGDTTTCACNSDNDGGPLPTDLNPLRAELGGEVDLYINRFYLDDGTEFGQAGSIVLNDFAVKANNQLDVDLGITNILVDITIVPKSGIIVLAGTLDLVLKIDKTFVQALANAKAQNKNLDIQLDENQTSIALGDVEVVKGSIWGGLPIGPLLDLLMPLIKGLIADTTPGIINSILRNELQNIVIGGTIMQPDTGASFQALFDVAELNTKPALGQFDLYTALDSNISIQGKDQSGNVNSTLGPVFVEDPINPAVIDNTVAGSNLTVALNTNLINAGLNALYATGVTHLTMYNGTTYYGGELMTPVDPNDATKTLAKKGDTRIRLWPDMAPALSFIANQSKDNTRAEVEYESATLYYDEAKEINGQIEWQTIIKLKVNFDLGVTIGQKDGAFVLGASGPPVFQINEMENSSAIQIPQALLQRVLDLALALGGGLLTDQSIAFDLGKIIGSGINGTVVKYLSATDQATITGTGEFDCIVYNNGVASAHPKANAVDVSTTDNKNDLVCQTIDFRVSTETVTAKGAKGSNLFFQMTLEDASAPPRMSIPNFDLDDDGAIDLRGDNCSVSGDGTGAGNDIVKAFTALSSENPTLAAEVDENGMPSQALEEEMRNRINKVLALRHGGSETAVPSTEDYDHYNTLRFWGNDPHINTGNAGAYPWITMMYNNPNQNQNNLDGLSEANPAGDLIGDLCEDDDDRDGVWASYDGIDGSVIPMPDTPATPGGNNNYAASNDNCASLYNPLQENTYGLEAGDACNVRVTYVMLRSYQTKVTDGVPKCLSHEGLDRSGWVSPRLSNANVKVCDSNDTSQHWYMQSINGVDLSEGVEFYDKPSRNPNTDSRLAAYGRLYESGCVGFGGSYGDTKVEEVRLVTTPNANLESENSDPGFNLGNCNESDDRADPVWYLNAASAIGSQQSGNFQYSEYPWLIQTKFDYNFGPSPVSNNKGSNECLTYSDPGDNFGVDIDSHGEQYSCLNSEADRHRWSIWAGAEGSSWNGTW